METRKFYLFQAYSHLVVWGKKSTTTKKKTLKNLKHEQYQIILKSKLRYSHKNWPSTWDVPGHLVKVNEEDLCRGHFPQSEQAVFPTPNKNSNSKNERKLKNLYGRLSHTKKSSNTLGNSLQEYYVKGHIFLKIKKVKQ